MVLWINILCLSRYGFKKLHNRTHSHFQKYLKYLDKISDHVYKKMHKHNILYMLSVGAIVQS